MVGLHELKTMLNRAGFLIASPGGFQRPAARPAVKNSGVE
jgi:hypothetical protein